MEIGINVAEYDEAVKGIQKANERSNNNSNNFNITFDNSDSNMITIYGEAIQELKSTLQTYSEKLTGDIEKLYLVRDEVVALDEQLAGSNP